MQVSHEEVLFVFIKLSFICFFVSTLLDAASPLYLSVPFRPILLLSSLLTLAMGGQSWQDRRILIQVSLNERRGNVGTIIDEKDARGVKEMLLRDLDLEQVCSFIST